MGDDPLAAIRAEIRRLLGAHPTPTRRRRLALDIHALAEEQERIAEAIEREALRSSRQKLTPRSPRAGPGAPAGDFLRIYHWLPPGGLTERLTIFIGRSLLKRWFDVAGEVRQVGFTEENGAIVLRAYDVARHQAGYKLDVSPGRSPRINCSTARDIVRRPDGWYAGVVEGTALIIGIRLERE